MRINNRDRGENQPVSDRSYEVAHYIRDNPGLSTQELASRLGISHSSLIARITGASSVLPIYEDDVNGRKYWYWLGAEE